MIVEDPIILLVDDSENDALLMCTVYGGAGFVRPLQFARDGEEAIAYLRGDGAFQNRRQFPLPAVVLLDLNMPRKSGFEVLEWIRAQPGFSSLRVYVLSASSREVDIQRAYDLGANAYLVKPGNLAGLRHLAGTLAAWLKLTHFTAPPEDSQGQPFAAPRAPGASRTPLVAGPTALAE
ncbi:MAG: response regulator [Pseudomonadota bacterium]